MRGLGDLAPVVQVGCRDMARRLMLGPEQAQPRGDARALLDRVRAARTETASFARVDYSRRLLNLLMYRNEMRSLRRKEAIRFSTPMRTETSSMDTGSSARISSGRQASA